MRLLMKFRKSSEKRSGPEREFWKAPSRPNSGKHRKRKTNLSPTNINATEIQHPKNRVQRQKITPRISKPGRLITAVKTISLKNRQRRPQNRAGKNLSGNKSGNLSRNAPPEGGLILQKTCLKAMFFQRFKTAQRLLPCRKIRALKRNVSGPGSATEISRKCRRTRKSGSGFLPGVGMEICRRNLYPVFPAKTRFPILRVLQGKKPCLPISKTGTLCRIISKDSIRSLGFGKKAASSGMPRREAAEL